MSTIEEIISDVCNGDSHAVGFCTVIYHWLHAIDDLYDRDKEITPEAWMNVNLGVMDQCHNNPFFKKHYVSLFPLIKAAFQAYASSERMRKAGEVRELVIAEVLKSQYQDIFYHVAFLCGGMEHQTKMEQKHRNYNLS